MKCNHFCSLLLFYLGILSPVQLWAQKAPAPQPNYGDNKAAGHYATLNGVRLYYEEYGAGKPLVLLHGNGGNITYMAPQIEYFAPKYRVIALDCRGRGKSELGKDSLTYYGMTKDLDALLSHLRLDSAYVIGRSDGGIIALLLAINYPAKVKKIAAFGANATPDAAGLFAKGYAKVIKDRKEAEQKIAQKDTSQNWPLIRQRMRMMEYQPHITAADLRKIRCEALIMSCDRDEIPEEHTLFIYKNIPKANLCIFPDETHRVTKENPSLFNTTVDRYFSQPYRGEEARGL